eukprot:2099990-Rhodomonas_salina.3
MRSHCGFGSCLASAVLMQVLLEASRAAAGGGMLNLWKVDCRAGHDSLDARSGPHDCARSQKRGSVTGAATPPAQYSPGGHRLPCTPAGTEAARGAKP